MAIPEGNTAADELLARREPLKDATIGRIEAARRAPGEGGEREDTARCREDVGAHVDALAAALRAAGAAQFGEYCAFTAVFLEGLGVPRSALGAALDALSETVGEQLAPTLAAIAQGALAAGRQRLDASPIVTPVALASIPAEPPAHDDAAEARGRAAEAATALARAAPRLAPMSVALSYMRRPGDALAHRARRGRCLEDARRHIDQLAAAVELETPALFGDYADWVRSLLTSFGVDPAELVNHLGALGDAIALALPEHLAEAPRRYLAAAIDRLTAGHVEIPSFVQPDAPLGVLACAYLDAQLQGDRWRAINVIRDAVDAGTPIKDIYAHVFQPCQYEIGRLWQAHQISIAEEHHCTAITQTILSHLYPLVFNADRAGRRLVATSVDGNLHEIGARFVADFFEMAGWDTFYLGASTPAQDVIDEVARRQADVLAVSATLGEHLRSVHKLITAARHDGRCRDVVLLVGGQPFRAVHGLWRQLGADGSAPTAEEAVRVAQALLAARSA
ncbi:cobalamin B12-binding domain-containing protein [Sorangium sp. So ce1335]|uniref:cobalamin B12-binding domain-containing protein n=1 Tax=Sorangium sp. So ce1335 TaxID=3133335 RepID=UPI003F60199F